MPWKATSARLEPGCTISRGDKIAAANDLSELRVWPRPFVARFLISPVAEVIVNH